MGGRSNPTFLHLQRSAGGVGNEVIANVSRALSSRLDYTKAQYRRELEPLEEKRERLMHDLAELREARAIFVEETTALNTRNEQLAELNAQIALQIQAAAADGVSMGLPGLTQLARGQGQLSQDTPVQSGQFDTFKSTTSSSSTRTRRTEPRERGRHSPSIASSATVNTLGGSQENSDEFGTKVTKVSSKSETPEPSQPKKFKWFGPGGKHLASSPASEKSPTTLEKINGNHVEKLQPHNFASANMLRIGRCDQCGEKLWGAGLRCTSVYYSLNS